MKWLIGCLEEERYRGRRQSYRNNMMSREENKLYEKVLIAVVVYGHRTWSLSAQDRRKIEVFEIMCLRNICGIRRVDRI